MRLLLLALYISAATLAQTTLPTNFVGFGAAYNGYSTPSVNGWASYGKNVGLSNTLSTYSFTTWDVTSQTLKPFVAQTSIRTGVMQVVFRQGAITAGLLGDIGFAAAGSNIGFATSTGAVVFVDLGIRLSHWKLIGAIRPFKSAISQGQYIYEFGFGKGF